MITRKDLLDLTYYEKGIFTGSDGNMRYRIEKDKDGDDKIFKTSAWPGPYAYPQTDPDRITVKTFPFTEEGIQSVTDWLNEICPDYQKEILSILDVEPYEPPKEN